MAGLLVSGTDTGVGKTVITGGLVALFRSTGKDVTAMKPLQTGVSGFSPEADAYFYQQMGSPLSPGQCTTYVMEEPLAPWVAARRQGITLDRQKILDHYSNLAARYTGVLVEGAGGLAVPLLDSQYTTVHLARDLGIPILLVARAGLGTVNHTILSVEYARQHGVDVIGVILNEYSGHSVAERTNKEVIETMSGLPVLGRVPPLEDLQDRQSVVAVLNSCLDSNYIWQVMNNAA